MSVLSASQIQSIEALLADSLRQKFKNYQPESIEMPFHTRLLGKDRMALFSFIHSVNTTLGTTIFEQVAVIIASSRFKHAQRKYRVGKSIKSSAQAKVDNIVNALIAGNREPDKIKEIAEIRASISSDETETIKPTVVDFMVIDKDENLYLFDIKSAKPNQGEFKGFKRTLLQWAATEITTNPNVKIHTSIAITYNPYAPQPYQRWTMKGLFDLTHELKVAEEFWDFIGGEGAYAALLECFERVGIAMRDEIDHYFAKFTFTNL